MFWAHMQNSSMNPYTTLANASASMTTSVHTILFPNIYSFISFDIKRQKAIYPPSAIYKFKLQPDSRQISPRLFFKNSARATLGTAATVHS